VINSRKRQYVLSWILLTETIFKSLSFANKIGSQFFIPFKSVCLSFRIHSLEIFVLIYLKESSEKQWLNGETTSVTHTSTIIVTNRFWHLPSVLPRLKMQCFFLRTCFDGLK
jgi:hypothetical protein